MKGIMKSSYPFKARLLAGLLALAFKAHAGYDAATWSPVNIVTDGAGNKYAYWNDPANWNTGVVPTFTNSVDGNLWGVHFAEPAGAIIPCVVSNNTQVGQVVVGDYGGGGYLIISNGASFTAGTADGNWTGVGYPNGPGTLYVGAGSVVTLGSHLWVGNGTGAQGTVIVDGGTIHIPNGQLGVSWNGIGGTNYITITNGGALYMSQWSSQTLGAPGSGPTNIGIMDIEANSQVVVTNNQLGYMYTLETNNQLIALDGLGTVQAVYNPALNTTILLSFPPPCCPEPVFSIQPANTIAVLGGTATLTAAASPATGYQWLFNSVPLTDGNGISGSKTATLTIAGVTAADVGYYSVLVSGPDQPFESAEASLSTAAFTFYPVVTVNGIPGNTYEVDYTTSLSSPVWTPLTTVTLASFTQNFVDTNSPMRIVRFYRVIQK
jgi:Immunoglobulin domain